MQEFLIGLGLLAVSGVTVVAYQHPKVYRDVLFGKLMMATLALCAVTVIWNAANMVTWKAMLPAITEGKLDAMKAAEGVSIPWGYSLGVFGAVYVYLFILEWLARHFEESRRGAVREP